MKFQCSDKNLAIKAKQLKLIDRHFAIDEHFTETTLQTLLH